MKKTISQLRNELRGMEQVKFASERASYVYLFFDATMCGTIFSDKFKIK